MHKDLDRQPQLLAVKVIGLTPRKVHAAKVSHVDHKMDAPFSSFLLLIMIGFVHTASGWGVDEKLGREFWIIENSFGKDMMVMPVMMLCGLDHRNAKVDLRTDENVKTQRNVRICVYINSH